MNILRYLTISLASIGLVACMSSAPYSEVKNVRFNDEKNGRTQVLKVVRDDKLCSEDTKDQQNCPIDFFIDHIKAGSFHVNNQTKFFIKPEETYNLKVKNCTDSCMICETEISSADLKGHSITLSVDHDGNPFMVNANKQLICNKRSNNQAAKKPNNAINPQNTASVRPAKQVNVVEPKIY